MAVYTNFFIKLEELGILSIIFPFILVFTITFAVLTKVRIFRGVSREKAINAVISLIIAMLFIASESRVSAMNSVLQKVTLLVVTVFLVQLTAVTAGGDKSFLKKWYFTAILFVLFLIVSVTAFGWFRLGEIKTLLSFLISPAMIMFWFFVLAVWYITRPSEDERKRIREEKKAKAEAKKKRSPSEQRKEGIPRHRLLEKPKLVKNISKKELYGGNDRTVWKGQ